MEFIRIRNENAIVMNYYRFYDDEVRAKTTVQINSMKTPLKIVGLDPARAEIVTELTTLGLPSS